MKNNNYTLGLTIVCCDGPDCPDDIEIDGFDGHCKQYKDINEDLKAEGWTTKNVDGEWLDFCPHCIETHNF